MDVLAGLLWLVSAALQGLWWLVRTVFGLPFRLLTARRNRRKAQGSARWAGRFEQWWYGAVRGEGILLGRGAFGRLLRFSSDGMVMVFAAMGAGKGLGVVIPSLLTYRGSMVVTDPKGENYAITRRRRAAFGKVWMLNPTDLTHSERFNPLDMVRRGEPQEADDAEALARLMVVPDAREAHWDTKAVSLIKGLILHVLHHEPPASRTLATVRRLTADQRETFLANLTHMAGNSPSPAAREILGGVLTSAVDSEGASRRSSSPSSPTCRRPPNPGRRPARRASSRPARPSGSPIWSRAPAPCTCAWMKTCSTCIPAGCGSWSVVP